MPAATEKKEYSAYSARHKKDMVHHVNATCRYQKGL